MKNAWKINLDPCVATRLRNTVNSDSNISIQGQKTLKGKNTTREYPSWNRVCVTMDRIEDLAYHINQMKITKDSDSRTAFAFLDLLNHASVLLDCIYEIARLYSVDMKTLKDSSEVFHMLGSDGRGTDKGYFEYLRSLCSVHPFQTDRHPQYQDSEFECCPYVCWNDGWPMKDCDLYAKIYLNKSGWDHYKDIPIRMDEIINHIEKTYNSIDTIVIPGIKAYQEAFREHHRKIKIKTENEFTNYADYLRCLGEEAEKRLDCDREYYTENICLFFEVDFQKPKNKRVLNKYRNALRYAISFHHTAVQNVSYEGYENNGLRFPESNYETTLLDCLLSVDSNSAEAKKHGYALKTAHELMDGDSTHYYVHGQLKTAWPFLEKYVDLSEADSDKKYYVLVRLALYADCLCNKNLLNQNIPNDLLYRFRRLGEKGWDKLHRERRPRKKAKGTLEQFLKQYSIALGNEQNRL